MPHKYPLFSFHEPYIFELRLYGNANIVDKVGEDNGI